MDHGIRTVLWLSGCNHRCLNCHNPETWDPNCGKPFDEQARQELFYLLSHSYCDGLTLTGGDPFFPAHREELASLITHIRRVFTDKTIWCWSGYTIEKLIPELISEENHIPYSIEYEILSNIDVLVDGPFRSDIRENDIKNPNSSEILKYRGSSNQRIIDIQKTLKERKVITYG